MKEKKEIITRELKALGQYYRNDWNGFDGRTLRDELDRLVNFMNDDNIVDFTEFTDQLENQEKELF